MSDATDDELPSAAFDQGGSSSDSDEDGDYGPDDEHPKVGKRSKAGKGAKGAKPGGAAAGLETGRKLAAIPLTEELEEPWLAPSIGPALMEEVLLVSQNLGLFVDLVGGAKLFVKGENSSIWLTDLQKALSREDNDSRLVSAQLHKLNVPHDKLFPFLLESLDNERIIVTMFKILLKLTKVSKDVTLFSTHAPVRRVCVQVLSCRSPIRLRVLLVRVGVCGYVAPERRDVEGLGAAAGPQGRPSDQAAKRRPPSARQAAGLLQPRRSARGQLLAAPNAPY
jgi:hypothetical protein